MSSRPNTTNIAECKRRVDECHEAGRIAVPYFEYNTMTDVKNEEVDFTGVQEYFGDAWKSARLGRYWPGCVGFCMFVSFILFSFPLFV